MAVDNSLVPTDLKKEGYYIKASEKVKKKLHYTPTEKGKKLLLNIIRTRGI